MNRVYEHHAFEVELSLLVVPTPAYPLASLCVPSTEEPGSSLPMWSAGYTFISRLWYEDLLAHSFGSAILFSKDQPRTLMPPILLGRVCSPHLTTIVSIRVLHCGSCQPCPRCHCVGRAPSADAASQSYKCTSTNIVEFEYQAQRIRKQRIQPL